MKELLYKNNKENQTLRMILGSKIYKIKMLETVKIIHRIKDNQFRLKEEVAVKSKN